MTFYDEYSRRRQPTMRELEELRRDYGRAVAHPPWTGNSLYGQLVAVDPALAASPTVYTLTEAQAAAIRDQIRAAPPTPNPTPRNLKRSNGPMNTRTKKLLDFMLNAPDDKYEAPRPTDEQLAAVLPWLVDQTVTWGRNNGYGSTAVSFLSQLIAGRYSGDERFFDANGIDCSGYDREGFNADGFNRLTGLDRDGYNSRGFDPEGYDREGYDRYTYDRDGFNRDGRDRYGNTREEAVAKLVGAWSKEHLAAVAAKLAERQAKADTKAAEEAAAEVVEAAAADTSAEDLVPVAA